MTITYWHSHPPRENQLINFITLLTFVKVKQFKKKQQEFFIQATCCLPDFSSLVRVKFLCSAEVSMMLLKKVPGLSQIVWILLYLRQMMLIKPVRLNFCLCALVYIFTY